MLETKCPTCGKDDFTNENYMKRHHKLIHDESLVEKRECSLDGCTNKTRNSKFCSDTCMGKSRREYEEQICKNSECETTVYKFDYCSRDCANKNTWTERHNPAKRPEVQKKISEKQIGDKNNMRRKGGHDEDAKKKISEAMSGEKHPLHGVKGKDHPSHGVTSGLRLQKVEETGHRVRSNWEKEIDLMLHKEDINYEYEPKTFELPNEDTYTPDFIIKGEIVIEVKGWPDEKSKERARLFIQKHSEYKYIVVGNEVPNDKFIAWEERDQLKQEIL